MLVKVCYHFENISEI